MINFDRIVENIFVGTCPYTAIDAKRLKSAGVTAVLNMQTDQDFKANKIDWLSLEQAYLQLDIIAYRFPIVDFDDEDLSKNLLPATKILENLMINNHCAYVHCNAGMQRSPSVVIGYLAWRKKFGLEAALELVTTARKCDPPVWVLESIETLNTGFSDSIPTA